MEPLALLLLLWLGLAIRTVLAHARHPGSARRRRTAPAADGAALRRFSRPKPAWVVQEVVRLKALMPKASVRTIATAFNTIWSEKREESVGKTWVAKVIAAHQLEIARKRAEIKKRRPWPMERNRVWALDLTYLPDIEHEPTPILGLIDHGSRACLVLREMRTKTTIAVLRVLLDAIEGYGQPRAVRTDNEVCFTSVVFRLVLAVLGIRHQRTTRPPPPMQVPHEWSRSR